MDNLDILAKKLGVHYPSSYELAMDAASYEEKMMAADAQTTTVTYSNAAIPAFLTTVVDPKIIEILVTPMKAAEIAGSEVKKGTWLIQHGYSQ